MNPALIFIYNHCHPENIDPLERIYGKRFKNIYHLMPFYEGHKRKNVIPVYDHSYYFHSFIPQGLNDYYKEEYTHYIFVADDYLLNPRINTDNFLEWFGLSSQTQDGCFYPDPFRNIGDVYEGFRVKPWAYNYSPQIPGFSSHKKLPSFKDALNRFEKLGSDTTFFKEPSSNTLASFYHDKRDDYYLYDTYHKALQHTNPPTRGRKILGIPYYTYLNPLWIFRIIRNKFKPYKMSYPLVDGCSDIFVIPASQIKKFAKYCSIFSAANLFVDISIPTAMILLGCPIVNGSVRELSTLKQSILHNDVKMFTGGGHAHQLKLDYNQQLNNLLPEYHSTNILGYHPFKLSQWDTNLSEDTLKLLGY